MDPSRGRGEGGGFRGRESYTGSYSGNVRYDGRFTFVRVSYADYYGFRGPFGTAGSGTPPACTGTYDPVNKTVTPGPCKTRRFERQPDKSDYYCFGTECPGPFLPL